MRRSLRSHSRHGTCKPPAADRGWVPRAARSGSVVVPYGCFGPRVGLAVVCSLSRDPTAEVTVLSHRRKAQDGCLELSSSQKSAALSCQSLIARYQPWTGVSGLYDEISILPRPGGRDPGRSGRPAAFAGNRDRGPGPAQYRLPVFLRCGRVPEARGRHATPEIVDGFGRLSLDRRGSARFDRNGVSRADLPSGPRRAALLMEHSVNKAGPPIGLAQMGGLREVEPGLGAATSRSVTHGVRIGAQHRRWSSPNDIEVRTLCGSCCGEGT